MSSIERESKNLFSLWNSKSIEDDSIEETIDATAPSTSETSSGHANAEKVIAAVAPINIENDNDLQKIKESCHDSGIDIRDPNLPPASQAKKNYSDADIVLSTDWVPPITIAPTDFTDTPSRSQTSSLGASLSSNAENVTASSRKKTSSVSFSVDDNSENQHHHSTSSDKTSDQNKKNKMLKRLSYPLAWVEGLTGEGKPPNESTESAPNTGDSNQSVFSKVFSR